MKRMAITQGSIHVPVKEISLEELGITASLENSKTVGVSQLGSLLITPLFTQKNTILDPRADLIITFLKYKPLIRLARFFFRWL